MISSCLMMVDLFPPYTLFIVQVPAFETVEGTPIYESNAIAYYGEFSRVLLLGIALTLSPNLVCSVQQPAERRNRARCCISSAVHQLCR